MLKLDESEQLMNEVEIARRSSLRRISSRADRRGRLTGPRRSGRTVGWPLARPWSVRRRQADRIQCQQGDNAPYRGSDAGACPAMTL
jgi:hypothetical protein